MLMVSRKKLMRCGSEGQNWGRKKHLCLVITKTFFVVPTALEFEFYASL